LPAASCGARCRLECASWGQAVEAEVAGIPDDGRALLFALGSLAGLMPRALAFHLVRACDALTGSNTYQEVCPT
jgi:hypothetical protein